MDPEKMMEILTQFSKENGVLSMEHINDIVELLTEDDVEQEKWNKLATKFKETFEKIKDEYAQEIGIAISVDEALALSDKDFMVDIRNVMNDMIEEM